MSSTGIVNRTIDDQFGDEVTGLQVCTSIVQVARGTLTTFRSPTRLQPYGLKAMAAPAVHPIPTPALFLTVCEMLLPSLFVLFIWGIAETWHDGTYTPSHGDDPLSFAFKFNGEHDLVRYKKRAGLTRKKGTAVYVFNVLPRLTLTNVNITLDGTFAANFTHFQNVSILEQYTYNVPIFAVDSLQYGEHTVAVTAVGSNTTSLLFDYAVYTFVFFTMS